MKRYLWAQELEVKKIYCFGAAKGEKEVPGFGVIFASAGLLIGAYLLRRRVKNGK